ncbi:MAG: U32 family peptidase [Thomasclavelia sp.]|nr:U32 family peptidase [Thomasclavelia sp.]
MELLVNLNRKEYINDFISMNVKCFVVGTKYFSCRTSLALEYKELDELCQKDINIYVLVNTFIHEDDLNDLKKHLNHLNQTKIKGIIFQDFSIMTFAKELNIDKELIYNPETLNTNYQTLNVLKDKGVNGAFIAREISLDEKNDIALNTDLKTIVQVHGCEFMSYSRRPLLRNYSSYNNVSLNPSIESNITIRPFKSDFKCHIYEDCYGTHILTSKQLCSLDIMSLFKNVDYLYIESLFIDPIDLIEVTHLYVQALEALNNNNYGKVKQELMPMLRKIQPKVEYDHSFMFDNTVYKISDVREIENND